MHILISGGWGYRNLGDDAILVSSINLIQNCYPEAQISVLSYSKEETEKILNNSIPVYSSIDYRLHTGIFEQAQYSAKGNLITRKIKKRVSQTISTLLVQQRTSYFIDYVKIQTEQFIRTNKEISDLFSQCIFILSGGGYLNSWYESLISKCIEIQIASYFKKKTIAFGVTIGPFHVKALENCFSYFFKNIDCVCVRDMDSLSDCIRLNIPIVNKIIPDIALFNHHKYESEKGVITIIPFTNTQCYVDNIVKGLQNVSGLKRVIVTVSQLWEFAKNNAIFIYNKLIEHNIPTTLIFPSDYMQLEEVLGKSDLVISQNLHGLILAYRSNRPIISLNNGRKFVTFMDMIGKEEDILPLEKIDSELLSQKINNYIEQPHIDHISSTHKTLLSSTFMDILDEVNK